MSNSRRARRWRVGLIRLVAVLVCAGTLSVAPVVAAKADTSHGSGGKCRLGASTPHSPGRSADSTVTTDAHGWSIEEFPLPQPNSTPLVITLGRDCALWFTEVFATPSRIGRMTVDGDATEYALPTPDARPLDILAAPDGNLWFTE